MAIFDGSTQEFHHFIGPRIRNAINNFTRNYRKKLNGICEECGQKKELHSAHVHGRERRTIIENVLLKYSSNGVIRCDIGDVEKQILNEQLPIETNFKFLCHTCHVDYDSQNGNNSKSVHIAVANEQQEFKKINRIKLWAHRPHQDNHKIISAFLHLEEEAEVLFEDLKNICTNKTVFPQYYVPTFEGHYPSMKTDNGHSHGKIFYDQNGIVNIWPMVREEIRIHFENNA